MNVIFCSAEVFPFAKTGGLADVTGTLPLVLESLGAHVTIVMPGYAVIDRERHHIKRLNNHVSSTVIGKDIQVLFIDHDGYFNRPGLYGDQSGDYPDNLKRFQYFCESTLRVLKQLNIHADLIHCHDWQTGLIPAYLKELYSQDLFFTKTKSCLTIHNLAYQGVFSKSQFSELKLNDEFFHHELFEFYDQINFLKGGIVLADRVTTVSPQYALDIQTTEFGCGLKGVLSERRFGVAGILNGLDYDFWNPELDPLITEPFSASSPGGKNENKNALCERFDWEPKDKTPIFGFVGRLSHQKGVDLILETAQALSKMDLRVVIQGLGDRTYQEKLIELSKRFPDTFAVNCTFDEKLAHDIYAGSDFFLMPSNYEPCGLSQMISLRYGTVPLVYGTGGLIDTISPWDKGGNGIVFNNYTDSAFIEAVESALKIYADRSQLEKRIPELMNIRFEWKESAKKYLEIYERCLVLSK